MTLTSVFQSQPGSSTGSGTSLIEKQPSPDGAHNMWTYSGTNGRMAIDDRYHFFWQFWSVTTNGWLFMDDPPAARSLSGRNALLELRSKTRLTWGQLARALGVHRRSLHLWAQGKRPNASNLERLMRLVEIVRKVDRGNPDETTMSLLEPQNGRSSVFTLLCENSLADLLAESSPPLDRRQRGERRPPQLSREERTRRRGIPPLERLEALHDFEGSAIDPLLEFIADNRRSG